MSEFDLIQRYFTRHTPSATLGVGDDAALLEVSEGMQLAVSTDMLVSGTHFFSDTDPFLLGHKALAVNLSDMAAMGATPRWATLALALPEVNEVWLKRFSAGFFALAEQYQVELIGGDTTRGPLNLSVTIMGEVPLGGALCRHGAQAADDIWVSGALGEAALALSHLQGRTRLSDKLFSACSQRLHQPTPRIELALALRGLAHSAIDISDGLLADLGHILDRSQMAAELVYENLSYASVFANEGLDEALVQRCLLSGGDDYELCFTAPSQHRQHIEALSVSLALPLTRIGKIKPGKGCEVVASNGQHIHVQGAGYDHFA